MCKRKLVVGGDPANLFSSRPLVIVIFKNLKIGLQSKLFIGMILTFLSTKINICHLQYYFYNS